jgi:hypothetical protein
MHRLPNVAQQVLRPFEGHAPEEREDVVVRPAQSIDLGVALGKDDVLETAGEPQRFRAADRRCGTVDAHHLARPPDMRRDPESRRAGAAGQVEDALVPAVGHAR